MSCAPNFDRHTPYAARHTPYAARRTPSSILLPMHGLEWIVDARGCHPAALRDETRLQALFNRLVADFALTPVAPAVWHRFPTPGGLTGVVVLAESHLACHTFPEYGAICLNLFCCRARPDADLVQPLRDLLGAVHVDVRCVARDYAAVEPTAS